MIENCPAGPADRDSRLDLFSATGAFDRFVRLSKGPFIGKEALEKQLKAGVPHRFVTLEAHDVGDADPA